MSRKRIVWSYEFFEICTEIVKVTLVRGCEASKKLAKVPVPEEVTLFSFVSSEKQTEEKSINTGMWENSISKSYNYFTAEHNRN